MNKMKKTNIDLIKYCENALKEKWFYGWGAVGQKASKNLVDGLVKQYPSMNTKWKAYMNKAITAKNHLCDCYGLVKGFLSFCDTGEIKVIPEYDLNTAGAFNKAVEKGTIDTLPELKGIILYMNAHVGIYTGNGRFIECAGGGVGMAEGKIKDGKVIKGSKFTHWFKDVNIEYVKEESVIEELPDKTIENPLTENIVSVIIEREEVQVKGGLVNDNNYVMLRDIADALGYIVEWTEEERIPILTKK